MSLTMRELISMRQTASLILPSICSISVHTLVPDGQGGQTETWTTTANIPCKMSTTLGRSGDQFTRLGEMHGTHHLVIFGLKYDQAITPGNRIVFSGDTYEVVGVDDSHDWRVLTTAIAKLVK